MVNKKADFPPFLGGGDGGNKWNRFAWTLSSLHIGIIKNVLILYWKDFKRTKNIKKFIRNFVFCGHLVQLKSQILKQISKIIWSSRQEMGTETGRKLLMQYLNTNLKQQWKYENLTIYGCITIKKKLTSL